MDKFLEAKIDGLALRIDAIEKMLREKGKEHKMEGEHGRGKPNYPMPMPRDKSFGENEQSIEDGYMGSKRGK